ncbi:hypothetical protein GGI35DRAFT_479363 [Trichoderma velutinum]
MRSSAFISLAFAALVAAAPTQEKVPDLPDGWFTGYNHANGTNTLVFHEDGQSFTFKPLTPDTTPADTGALSKRSGSQCWTSFPKLPQAGTDAAIAQWRSVTQQTLQYAGNGGSACGGASNFPPYIGYNNGGVYVYFCYNSNDQGNDSCSFDDVQEATLNMDQTCGSYVPGYFQWDSPSLFGKCASGTAVCQGNSRSPRK